MSSNPYTQLHSLNMPLFLFSLLCCRWELMAVMVMCCATAVGQISGLISVSGTGTIFEAAFNGPLVLCCCIIIKEGWSVWFKTNAKQKTWTVCVSSLYLSGIYGLPLFVHGFGVRVRGVDSWELLPLARQPSGLIEPRPLSAFLIFSIKDVLIICTEVFKFTIFPVIETKR